MGPNSSFVQEISEEHGSEKKLSDLARGKLMHILKNTDLSFEQIINRIKLEGDKYGSIEDLVNQLFVDIGFCLPVPELSPYDFLVELRKLENA